MDRGLALAADGRVDLPTEFTVNVISHPPLARSPGPGGFASEVERVKWIGRVDAETARRPDQAADRITDMQDAFLVSSNAVGKDEFAMILDILRSRVAAIDDGPQRTE